MEQRSRMSASPAAFSPIPRDELRLQQLNQLYAQSRLPQWLLLVTAVLITPLAWAHSTRSSLLVWIALLGLLGATGATLYQWRYRREGPPGFRVGRYVRYRRTDVEAWIERQLDSVAT